MEFTGLLDTVEKYIEKLRPLRETQDGLDNALKLIVEIRFNGQHNQNVRNECVPLLEALLDDMYLEIHKEGK